jgi:hypothetical protein
MTSTQVFYQIKKPRRRTMQIQLHVNNVIKKFWTITIPPDDPELNDEQQFNEREKFVNTAVHKAIKDAAALIKYETDYFFCIQARAMFVGRVAVDTPVIRMESTGLNKKTS